jgi:hypothetical protein
MDATELASRFSFMPNKLKYCGPDGADRILYDHVLTKRNKAEARKLLMRFEALSLYLRLIAKKNNLDVWDAKVIEAYWIGNQLLDKVNKPDIKELITKEFTKKGLPESVALRLSNNVPKECTPHHSFHVMHIHSVSGKVKFMYGNIDKCRISWGEIKKIADNLEVEYMPIIAAEKITLGNLHTKKVKFDKDFIGPVKEGDFVAMHWDYAVCKLNKEQKQNLENYTMRNILAINSLSP